MLLSTAKLLENMKQMRLHHLATLESVGALPYTKRMLYGGQRPGEDIWKSQFGNISAQYPAVFRELDDCCDFFHKIDEELGEYLNDMKEMISMVRYFFFINA